MQWHNRVLRNVCEEMTTEQKNKKAELLIEESRETDDLQRQESLLQQAVQLNPKSSESFEELGKCYLYLGQIDRAEVALQTALDLEDNGWSRLYLGNIHYRGGEYKLAEKQYKLGRRFLSDLAAPLWCIADVRWAAGDLVGGEDYYRQAAALEPDDAGTLARLGRFLIETERREEGEPYLRKALACDPTDSFAKKYAKLLLDSEFLITDSASTK